MGSFSNFLKYNNIVPITVSVVLLGAGSTFAATNPDSIVGSHDRVVSEDNTYVMSADIEHRDFKFVVTNVVEDPDTYYISYQYQTIAPVDYIWQEKTISDTITVSKKEITGIDLGLFVAKQLGETLVHERQYLLAVQNKEKEKGISHKTVATTYSGLVGQFFDPTEENFPGYIPVVAAVALASSTEPVGATEGAAANTAAAAYIPVVVPHGPTQAELQAMIAEAVTNALNKKLTGEQPPADTPPASSPAEPPPADAPPAETPPAETPPADTPPAETPPAETPPPEAPPAETPPAETPPAETPPAETPPPPPPETPPAETPAP